MTTNKQLNRRKRKLGVLTRKMKEKGYEFKKVVKNTVTFRHVKTNEKLRVNLLDCEV
jgi:hypothetical protein